MRILRNYGLLALWLVTIVAMAHDYYVRDPVDPTLQGTAAYGHNADGSLLSMGLLTTIELCVLYGLLRPWSASARERGTLSRIGWVIPLVLFWTVITLFLAMHAGGVVFLHTGWLLLVLSSLVCAFVVTAIVRVRAE